jgi:hypothetical protein
MYSGNDIAIVDTATKKIVAETDYDYKNLLTGDTGCENEMANPIIPFPKQLSGGASSTGSMLSRPDYPLPHLYDYPLVPNPFDSSQDGLKGFLFFASYTYWPDWGSNTLAKQATIDLCKAYEGYGKSTDYDCTQGRGPDYLYVNDLITWEGAQTGLLGYVTQGDFERDILKIY